MGTRTGIPVGGPEPTVNSGRKHENALNHSPKHNLSLPRPDASSCSHLRPHDSHAAALVVQLLTPGVCESPSDPHGGA